MSRSDQLEGSIVEFGVDLGNMEFAQYRNLAQAAEALGFDQVTVGDHIVHEQLGGQYDQRYLAYDAMMVAAAIADATKKIRVGHLVLCNLFRHPAIVAQSLSSLDHLSGGRALAGFGTGWTKSEFDMIGMRLPPAGERLGMLDEALSCIRSLWTKERTSLRGEHYNLDQAILWPKPVQQPHPPILVGGGGKGTMRLAAKHADYVNIIAEIGAQGQRKTENFARFSEDRFKQRVRLVREEAVRHGRDPRAVKVSVAYFNSVLADSPAAAKAAVQGVAAMLGATPETVRRAALILIGTAEEWVSELRRRAKELVIEQVIISVGDEATLRRIGEQVLPNFRR